MILSPIELLFVLVVLHNLADYPLQGQFLSDAKNPNTILGKMFWPYALSAHALIHGGAVFLATHSLALALLETIFHAVTDWLKCEGKISMLTDQAIHYGCKIVWTVIIWKGLL
jgi:hypothetical protein